MGQWWSVFSFDSLICVLASGLLQTLAVRFLPAKYMCFSSTIGWSFTCFCLKVSLGKLMGTVLFLHALVAALLFNFYGSSIAVLNRTLLYPAAGSLVMLFYPFRLPVLSVGAAVLVGLLQLWSAVSGLLMLLVYPATILSQLEPAHMRGSWLEELRRQAVDRLVERLEVPSRNGVVLDVVLLRRRVPTERWVFYIGGNAEIMKDCAADIFTEGNDMVCANWIFFNPRGVGESTGYVACVEDLVVDAFAVVQYTSQQYKIDPSKLLLWGHSIGGGVAAALASRYHCISPILLDRTFSSLSDAAVRFTCLPPTLTRKLIQYTVGDLNVVGSCMQLKNKKLVIYHRRDEVISYSVASLGRTEVVKKFILMNDAVVELNGMYARSPHNTSLGGFQERDLLRSRISFLFE
ncbi:uncharacterized protein TM35_000044040 [Trypanosoma theileri]|uniref:Serine aminopeptidase S33 domain-containing protein n=1 Tax=Trypanosoma theileri TaxID=67003 RepID=A0A1X0P6X8_9TRYP|nr:uncharacterized protein TM35_000044040 [Trypanosoma theileri]ORC92190.1 hypothetical protein TM35_000044040 [Trypanosoma theileri]